LSLVAVDGRRLGLEPLVELVDPLTEGHLCASGDLSQFYGLLVVDLQRVDDVA
jgi:hypothetical protein